MFERIKILAAFRHLAAAVQARDLSGALAAGQAIAAAAGYGEDAAAVAHMVAAGAAGNWAALLLALADLLTLVARRFFSAGPAVHLMASPEPVLAALSHAEQAPAGETLAVPADAHAAGLAALALADACRAAA
jgi:hypothetical protein